MKRFEKPASILLQEELGRKHSIAQLFKDVKIFENLEIDWTPGELERLSIIKGRKAAEKRDK
jgi:hypothetical protein